MLKRHFELDYICAKTGKYHNLVESHFMNYLIYLHIVLWSPFDNTTYTVYYNLASKKTPIGMWVRLCYIVHKVFIEESYSRWIFSFRSTQLNVYFQFIKHHNLILFENPVWYALLFRFSIKLGVSGMNNEGWILLGSIISWLFPTI